MKVKHLVWLVMALTGHAIAAEQTTDNGAYKRCDEVRGTLNEILAVCGKSLKETGLSERTRARMHVIQGVAYRDSGFVDDAMREYTEAVRIDSQYALGYNAIGALWNRVGQPAKAIPEFDKAISLDATKASIFSNRSATWAKLGQPSKALEDVDQAIKLEPSNLNYYFDRAIIYSDLVGDNQRALADYDLILRLDPKLVQAWNNRAVLQSDPEKKMADLNEAIKIWPGFPMAHANRGEMWMDAKNWDYALADFDIAIRGAPDFSRALIDRGLVWAQKLDTDKAMADLTQAIRVDPENPQAYFARGEIWRMLGEKKLEETDKATYKILDAKRVAAIRKRAQ